MLNIFYSWVDDIILTDLMATAEESTILVNVELETYPSIQYPTLAEFLDRLDNEEPLRHWRERFFWPLRRLGVRTLDDMAIVSPESIFVFYGLNPIAIMDLYVHVVDTIDGLHRDHGISTSALNGDLSRVRKVVNHFEWVSHVMLTECGRTSINDTR